jgi:hypothetical protein
MLNDVQRNMPFALFALASGSEMQSLNRSDGLHQLVPRTHPFTPENSVHPPCLPAQRLSKLDFLTASSGNEESCQCHTAQCRFN